MLGALGHSDPISSMNLVRCCNYAPAVSFRTWNFCCKRMMLLEIPVPLLRDSAHSFCHPAFVQKHN